MREGTCDRELRSQRYYIVVLYVIEDAVDFVDFVDLVD
eukprot:SAG11_NODE_764_length_7290_cov_9.187596_2_plen_38_part_00